jgi:hypothetical protein
VVTLTICGTAGAAVLGAGLGDPEGDAAAPAEADRAGDGLAGRAGIRAASDGRPGDEPGAAAPGGAPRWLAPGAGAGATAELAGAGPA